MKVNPRCRNVATSGRIVAIDLLEGPSLAVLESLEQLAPLNEERHPLSLEYSPTRPKCYEAPRNKGAILSMVRYLAVIRRTPRGFRYEKFGGIVHLERPRALVFVDRDRARRLGYRASPLWQDEPDERWNEARCRRRSRRTCS